MKRKRQDLEETLKDLKAKRDAALEPVLKRRRKEEATITAPFDMEIEAVQKEIEAEKNKCIWLVIANPGHQYRRCLCSAYLTREEAEARRPANSRTHTYVITPVHLDRTLVENRLGDDPVSK